MQCVNCSKDVFVSLLDGHIYCPSCGYFKVPTVILLTPKKG